MSLGLMSSVLSAINLPLHCTKWIRGAQPVSNSTKTPKKAKQRKVSDNGIGGAIAGQEKHKRPNVEQVFVGHGQGRMICRQPVRDLTRNCLMKCRGGQTFDQG